jgi:hypothetical protein
MVLKNDFIMQTRLKVLVIAEIVFYSNPRHYISCFYERNISDRPIEGCTGPFSPTGLYRPVLARTGLYWPILAHTGPYWPILAPTSISSGVLAELLFYCNLEKMKFH